MTNNPTQLTEREKVHKTYSLIGERGLYVNTNFDVFSETPEEVRVGNQQWTVPLLNGGNAYASPLLLVTLTSLLKHGTMLLTGAPGIGKTTSAEFAGSIFTGTPLEEMLAAEIQGHPQQTEEKMVARYDIGQLTRDGKEIVLPRKFIKSPVKIIDEGRRLPPDVLSIIMRLVDTGQAVYGEELLRATPGPLFVTANYMDEGSFDFTPPFYDRFDVAVMVTSPSAEDLNRIRMRADEKLNGGTYGLLQVPEEYALDFDKIRHEIRDLPEAMEDGVPVMSAFADFLYAQLRFCEIASDSLARATKGNAWRLNQDHAPEGHFKDAAFTRTNDELSIRTVKAMQRYARAFAWFEGESEVGLEDLKPMLPYLLWHKVRPSNNGIITHEKWKNDHIGFVKDLVTQVETEYTAFLGSNALRPYSAALEVIRTGKFQDTPLSEEKIRTSVIYAIQKIGETDAPYALSLAQQVANEYNQRMMRSRK
jgi:MoxR-like ATPase